MDPKLGPLKPLSTADTRALVHQPEVIGSGTLVESFGYERDNPAARFFLRDLVASRAARAGGLAAIRPGAGAARAPAIRAECSRGIGH